jgi:hypothetical protein
MAMSATVVPFRTFTQQRHAESLLEADNAWLERQLVDATIANDELVRHVIAAEERAEKAERRLQSRLIELTWPATLGGIVGGVALVGLLKVAGL